MSIALLHICIALSRQSSHSLLMRDSSAPYEIGACLRMRAERAPRSGTVMQSSLRELLTRCQHTHTFQQPFNDTAPEVLVKPSCNDMSGDTPPCLAAKFITPALADLFKVLKAALAPDTQETWMLGADALESALKDTAMYPDEVRSGPPHCRSVPRHTPACKHCANSRSS